MDSKQHKDFLDDIHWTLFIQTFKIGMGLN